MGEQRPKILLVEDQALVAMEFEAMLTDLGCAVIGPYGRVAPALEAVRREPLDGAVLDVNLAGERSFPIARALQERQIQFFFLTGLESSALPTSLHHVPHLTKPVRADAFAALVLEILKPLS